MEISEEEKIDWDAAFNELEEIYRQVDTEISAEKVICHQCGKCCNFWENGMRLYIYNLEREYIKKHFPNMLHLNSGCCGAQEKKLCKAHLIRPLGCRTQFCSKTLQEIYEKYAYKIREIEKKYNIIYEYSEAFEG